MTVIPPIIEHGTIPEVYWEQLSDVCFEGNPADYIGKPRYLGIDRSFTASYYIGASWLKDDLAVVVTPKMSNVDFVCMFLAALEVDSEKESDYFSRCYGIQIEEPQITVDERLNQLTPLLVLHFVSLLERLVKRGLKKDYIIREENLKSKIKGKMMLTRHLQKNDFQQRGDRVYCQYQECTEDIPENRLLKKALLFADRIISSYESLKKQKSYAKLQSRLYKLKAAFENVSEEIEIGQVQRIYANKLFKEYKGAVKVAKMILRRFDYSIHEAGKEQQTTPPFWIDMARLYELYVYSKLNAAYPEQIVFQVDGHCKTAVDFIKKDERLIMDAKYKPHYLDSNHGIIDDIREISGYARDWKILNRLGIRHGDSEEVKCLIIYPVPTAFRKDDTLPKEENKEAVSDDCKQITVFVGSMLEQSSPDPWFRSFYRVSIPLPTV